MTIKALNLQLKEEKFPFTKRLQNWSDIIERRKNGNNAKFPKSYFLRHLTFNLKEHDSLDQ